MHRAVLCGLLCSVVSLGCGEENPLNRQPVSGTVKLEGQPLERGSITFDPQGGGGVLSGGTITDGKYEIPAEKGLTAGEYTVRISAATGGGGVVEEMPGETTDVPEEMIPAEYNEESKEVVKVEAGGKNVFDFAIPNKRASE